MNLNMASEIAKSYKSLSQQARVMTETWAEENLYCPACPSDILSPTPKGEKVIDFTCPHCNEFYQLKSQSHPFGNSVANSAYEPKIRAIKLGTIPSFFFLRYNPRLYRVLDLFLVPKHFMSPSIIERRKPLSDCARRHGWVGSNILLGKLPMDARIPLVKNENELPRPMVRNLWNRFMFLRERSISSRGWLADVLACVRELNKETFTLDEAYLFEKKLAKLHPKNRHIRPKIRQQLQVLRDHDILEFVERGNYKIKN